MNLYLCVEISRNALQGIKSINDLTQKRIMKAKVFLMLALAYLQVGATNLAEMALSRGYKNNNPLNLVHDPSNRWVGLVGHDGRFCCFDSVQHGFRAAFITIHTYMIVHGLDTVDGIISRWAPEGENNTKDYIWYVCGEMKCKRYKVLDFYSSDEMCALVGAMAKMESGKEFDKKIIRAAYCNALKSVAAR